MFKIVSCTEQTPQKLQRKFSPSFSSISITTPKFPFQTRLSAISIARAQSYKIRLLHQPKEKEKKRKEKKTERSRLKPPSLWKIYQHYRPCIISKSPPARNALSIYQMYLPNSPPAGSSPIHPTPSQFHLHVNHLIKPQDPISPQNPIHALRHAIRALRRIGVAVLGGIGDKD